MAEQMDFLGGAPAGPEGFRYERELITPAEEAELVTGIRKLPFREFEFHGFVGHRRTVSFGWKYDFSREALDSVAPLPPFLYSLRDAAAMFAGRRGDELVQTLVTEYRAGAAIGWHRDKAVFGDVIGASLLSPVSFRLRRRVADRWERATIEAEPRSIYLLSGPARTEWEHSIPPVKALRYSVTFRTMATHPG